jgi:hypothetical protein
MKAEQIAAAEYIRDLASELVSFAKRQELHHIAYCLELTVADAMAVAGKAPKRHIAVLH